MSKEKVKLIVRLHMDLLLSKSIVMTLNRKAMEVNRELYDVDILYDIFGFVALSSAEINNDYRFWLETMSKAIVLRDAEAAELIFHMFCDYNHRYPYKCCVIIIKIIKTFDEKMYRTLRLFDKDCVARMVRDCIRACVQNVDSKGTEIILRHLKSDFVAECSDEYLQRYIVALF